MTSPDRVRALFNSADIPPAAPQQPTPEGIRELVFQRASGIKPRPVRWAWDTAAPGAPPQLREGRFPIGSLVIAAGRAGVGKSQFAAWMTARITTGTLPGQFWGTPRSAVYAATEDSWAMTIVPRLIAAGANLDKVYRVAVTDDNDSHARLTLPADTSLLEKGITEHDIVLVVMDPLLSLIDSSINDYRAKEVRQALEPLVAVADRTKVLLLGLAHFTKAAGNDPLMLVSGSAAFGQLVRAAVAFARDEDHDDPDHPDRANQPVIAEPQFVCSTIKNNLGREDLPSLAYRIQPHPIDTDEGQAWVSRLHFTGHRAPRSVRDVLRNSAGSTDPHEQTERQTAAKWLTDYLTATDKAPSAQVKKAATQAGFTERTLARARVQLRVHVTDEGFPRTSYWSLPVTDLGPATPAGITGGTTVGGTTANWPSELQVPAAEHGRLPQSCHIHACGTTNSAPTETTTHSDGRFGERWRISGDVVTTPPQTIGQDANADLRNGQPHSRLSEATLRYDVGNSGV